MIYRAVTTLAVLLLTVQTPFNITADKTPTNGDLVKVEVATLLLNEEDRNFVLVLKPEQKSMTPDARDERRVLPLVIGLEEGRSIGVAFHKIGTPRPLTHDLMKTIVEEYGGSVTGVVITKMERETFFAELRLKRAGREFTIDCRPSDAIGLALRSGAPVFVRRDVMTRHGIDPANPDKTDKPIKT